MKRAIPVLCLLLWSQLSYGTVIHVPWEQATIQAGIELAISGDTVLVAPGTFAENLDFMGKDIRVIGSGGAAQTYLVPTSSTDPAVRIVSGESEYAMFRGFTLAGWQNVEFLILIQN
jgi:hypothetical protein